MDDVPSVAYIPPSGRWARIELEPVRVRLEADDSILLSAIQSVIPGAHGLYYTEENKKIALRYDGATGRIEKGSPGHTCRHYAGQFESAMERFEKTVSTVQPIFDQSGPNYPFGPAVLSKLRGQKGKPPKDQQPKIEDQNGAAGEKPDHASVIN
ncbi:unnamed protein product [Thelazia callipaeda]|uniref:TDP43_N domain-containing protein n=1 Tax=Thelazia callipaeda TaxID=103827 RepID=A0A158RBS3_THECL|nr:unnamed protein product [Thelazia callipaeda]